jgi:hypothetical protein
MALQSTHHLTVLEIIVGSKGRPRIKLTTSPPPVIRLSTNCWTLLIYLVRGLSPRAKYTDRATAAKLVPNLADRGCHEVSVMDPYGRKLGFLDRYWALHVSQTHGPPLSVTGIALSLSPP